MLLLINNHLVDLTDMLRSNKDSPYTTRVYNIPFDYKTKNKDLEINYIKYVHKGIYEVGLKNNDFCSGNVSDYPTILDFIKEDK